MTYTFQPPGAPQGDPEDEHRASTTAGSGHDSASLELGAEDPHTLASRWSRLAAVLIDAAIGIAIMIPAAMVSGMWDALIAAEGNVDVASFVRWFVLGELVFFAVNGYLLVTRQQTVGKMLQGIQIVGIDEDKVHPGKLLGLRYLLFHFLVQLPGTNIIGLVNALLIFRKDRRCLHDHIAGTRVVEAAPGL